MITQQVPHKQADLRCGLESHIKESLEGLSLHSWMPKHTMTQHAHLARLDAAAQHDDSCGHRLMRDTPPLRGSPNGCNTPARRPRHIELGSDCSLHARCRAGTKRTRHWAFRSSPRAGTVVKGFGLAQMTARQTASALLCMPGQSGRARERYWQLGHHTCVTLGHSPPSLVIVLQLTGQA